MTTAESILTEVTIAPGPFQTALLEFVATSALSHCATAVTHHAGYATVTLHRDYRMLSSGEQRLWRLLLDMIGGDIDWLTLFADHANRQAFARCVTRLMADDPS